MTNALNQIFVAAGMGPRVENFHSIFYFNMPSDLRFASLFYHHLRLHGIHAGEGFPCFLTTVHTDEDLDRIADGFRNSIGDMQEGGLLPTPRKAEPIECPLTEAQMEIRLSAQLGDEESCAFNEGFTLTLDGVLDLPAIRSALSEIVSRHESLRATLHSEGDRLLIHPSMTITMEREIKISFSL